MYRQLFIGLALGLAAVAARAGAPASAPPPVEAFFGNSTVSSTQISPDGKYLAVVIADDATGESDKYLSIIGADDRKIKASFQVSEDQVIWRFWWANDERVLVATATYTGALSVPTIDGALYAVNVDGNAAKQLLGEMADDTPVPDQSRVVDTTKNFSHIQHHDKPKPAHVNRYFGGMLYIPRDDAHHVLMEGRSSGEDHEQVFDVDVYSGDIKVITQSPITGPSSFLADADGNARIVWGTRNRDGAPQLFYRDAGNSATWQDLSALYKGVDPVDSETGPLEVAQDGKSFYWWGRTSSTTLGIFQVNPSDLSMVAVFSDPVFDTDVGYFGDLPGNDHKLLAVETEPGLPELHVIDGKDPEAGVFLALTQAFPRQHVTITSATRDGNSMVVYVASDRNPGDYYLFNTKTLKADLVFATLEDIDPDSMATMQPVSLTSRDGLSLHGYLTVPANKAQKHLPLILLPHGGPHGIRDYWGWNPEAQFFASRGYAVLQVNFRGSGGYGLKFQSLGYRNWGTTMQDDLADAVQWAVKQGIADPDRVCIYGASYGGYAALENPIRYPQLYKCAVGYVGVYDLITEAKYSDIHGSVRGRNYLEIVNGNDTAELKKYSPAFNADKLTIPVFIAYGGRDRRVVPDNAKELMAAMDAAGKKYESLFDPYEVHGFGKPEDRFELYTRMLKFIDSNIGDAAAKPATGTAGKAGSP